MRGDRYQIALIVLGIAVTGLLGYFLFHEIYPEYRIYQEDYIALEEFRSTYTHEPPPAFAIGVKQIVFEREDKGPAAIDRCTSCHVALQLTHFSPTKIAYDADGKIVRNAEGTPVQVPNENNVWFKIDQKIAALTDSKVNEQLIQQGDWTQINSRKAEADRLGSLKVAVVDDQVYDVTKVLAMHPLIGKETRPFEFHPIDEYGCTVCHSGNGRGLTTDKAHGPVFDGQYGIDFEGPTPEFTEIDPQNDPRFSIIFNHKPDDSLVFQTTPILVGSLIQSSCVQCHKQKDVNLPGMSSNTPEITSGPTKTSDVYRLTKNFHRGQQLFISQACYACHKIAGTARGGVGPELTHEGSTYPWFLKESIVWPQADLPTSTMPNYTLDHVELEDLMTYLLAQKGPTKATSAIEYKVAIQEWEAGKKQPWEKAVPPSQVHNLRDSMTIFATQGCSACHRLEGFESNVGYRIEQNNKPSFDALYQEREWFKKLFPEEIRGSKIVKVIDKHKDEIDQHIVNDVRKDSLLEEIDAKFPDNIESFYSNFRFAARSKNAYYNEMANKATTPEEKQKALNELKEWQDRVHRILYVYIQEYGFGRLIGPRPNWSGVYRSDEWLMEHFHNPGGHVARSIMPVFPFDDSKFYALTYMLDVLGKRNRNAVQEIWQHKGFNPEQAFQLYCSQCHGTYLQGNGPVATWIYPIPKNLRNAEFLRNLTKENARQSIMHGVKGTPMPPWGETPHDKENYDGIPVLSHDQINKLVDWLYRALPGATVIKGIQDVPKWHYMPEDILEEIHHEGGILKSKPKPTSSKLSLATQNNHLYASAKPLVTPTTESITPVNEVFDVLPNPIKGPDEPKQMYFIKQEYYTPENIQKGKTFFAINCAVCHGADADGSGARAGIMFDAKPRMLINLDWINTRDDLRLLRSIKYGVKGTAMTPWGDFTSSLQRLQLVMYIRSLTFEKERREALAEALYQTFESAKIKIEHERIAEYEKLATKQKESDEILNQRQNPTLNDLDAIALFKKQLEINAELKKLQARDQIFIDRKLSVEKQQLIFLSIGNSFLSANVDDSTWKSIIKIIKNYNDPKESNLIAQEITQTLDAATKKMEEERVATQGKLASPNRDAELHDIDLQIATSKRLKNQLLSGLKEVDVLSNEAKENK